MKMSKVVIRLEKVKTLREISQRELHNTRGKQAINSDGIGNVIIEGTTGVAKEIDKITKQMNIVSTQQEMCLKNMSSNESEYALSRSRSTEELAKYKQELKLIMEEV